MALRIRLARGGAKKRPFYRVVVAENTSPRDGKFVERVGSYNPLLDRSDPGRLIMEVDRVKYWLSVGANASDRVNRLLAELNVIDGPVITDTPKKSAPKKKAQERMKAAAGGE
jgi:small subunit ribosomal protein S16